MISVREGKELVALDGGTDGGAPLPHQCASLEVAYCDGTYADVHLLFLDDSHYPHYDASL